MFTIDLLKGEGLPAKQKAQNVIVAVLAIAVPVAAAITVLGFYLNNRIMISIQKGKISGYKEKTENLSAAVAKQKALELDRAAYGTSLAEVRTALRGHVQWSPILANVVRDMPGSVVLTALEVKNHPVTYKVPKKDEPDKTTDVSVLVPTLLMNVAATPQSDGDRAVRAFRDSLRASALLGPKLEDITVSQKADELSGLDVVSYEINCIFKPQL